MSLYSIPPPTSAEASAPLRWWSAQADRALQVTVLGELDFATAAGLERALQPAGPDVDLVVVDLRALEFMDSSGVHLLLTADRRLRWTGARLVVVVRFGSDVEWLLALTGADRRLELSDYLPDLEARRRTSPAQPRREKMG